MFLDDTTGGGTAATQNPMDMPATGQAPATGQQMPPMGAPTEGAPEPMGMPDPVGMPGGEAPQNVPGATEPTPTVDTGTVAPTV